VHSAVHLETALSDSHVFARCVANCSVLPSLLDLCKLANPCFHVWSLNEEVTTRNGGTTLEVQALKHSDVTHVYQTECSSGSDSYLVSLGFSQLDTSHMHWTCVQLHCEHRNTVIIFRKGTNCLKQTSPLVHCKLMLS
jgi:hypothetical protein